MMDKIVLDSAVAGQLANAKVHVPICDPSGHTVGYFIPAAEHDREVYQWAKSQISEEELDRRATEPGGRTTEEILKDLQRR
jgi:hypothetical protein